MDPEEAYRNMVELARSLLAARDNDDADLRYALDDAMELAEAVEALDGWLRKGGFPPKAWAGRAGRGRR